MTRPMQSAPAKRSVDAPSDVIATRPCPNCYLCGTPGVPLYHGLPDRLFGASGEWNLSRCPAAGCGLIWLDPMPLAEDIGKAYETYFTHGDSAVAEARPGLARRVWRAMKRAYIAREFPTDAPSGRLLWLLALPIRLSRFARDQI